MKFFLSFLGLYIFALGFPPVWAESCTIRELSDQSGNRIVRTRGVYSSSFEHSGFHACESALAESWWLTTPDEALWRRLQVAASGDGKLSVPQHEIYIELEGCLSAEGSYGHLGAYKRHIQADKVLLLREEIPLECTKDLLTISELNMRRPSAGNFKVIGYVAKHYSCPPCSADMLCKPCMRNNIVVSDFDKPLDAYDLSNHETIIFTDDPYALIQGQRYLFAVRMTDRKTTNELLNDLELVAFKAEE